MLNQRAHSPLHDNNNLNRPMRLSISLLASLGLVGTIAAQSNNVFENYSGSTNFTTRSALPGTSTGDVCQRWNSALLSCFGQYQIPGGALVHRMAGWQVVIQDQSGVSQELWTTGLIDDDPAAPGTPLATADLLRAGPFATPTSSATGPVAWIFTITLATPYDSLPTATDFHACVGVPSNAAWTADGVSIHMSGWTTSPVDNPYLNGANPIPQYVGTIDRTNPASPIKSGNNTRFQRIALFGPGPQMKVGADIDPAFQVCPNPNFGCGGMYPDQNASRLDGLAFKLNDANLPASLFAIVGNIGPKAPIVLNLGAGWNGDICVNAFALLPVLLGTGVTGAAGDAVVTTFAFPNTWSHGVGEMHFQAAIIDGGGFFNMTNGAGNIAQ